MNSKPTMKQENVIFPALLFFFFFSVMLVAFALRSTKIEPRPTQLVVAKVTEEIFV